MPVEITFSIFILKHKNMFLNTNFFDISFFVNRDSNNLGIKYLNKHNRNYLLVS